MPVIPRDLRSVLVADILIRASAWRHQEFASVTDQQRQACQGRAAVLEQLAHDLEDGSVRPCGGCRYE
jgi:hypothetical protein